MPIGGVRGRGERDCVGRVRGRGERDCRQISTNSELMMLCIQSEGGLEGVTGMVGVEGGCGGV